MLLRDVAWGQAKGSRGERGKAGWGLTARGSRGEERYRKGVVMKGDCWVVKHGTWGENHQCRGKGRRGYSQWRGKGERQEDRIAGSRETTTTEN